MLQGEPAAPLAAAPWMGPVAVTADTDRVLIKGCHLQHKDCMQLSDQKGSQRRATVYGKAVNMQDSHQCAA